MAKLPCELWIRELLDTIKAQVMRRFDPGFGERSLELAPLGIGDW